MSQSLSKGFPILLKEEIVQRVYTNKDGQRRTFQYIAPEQFNGITFFESAAIRRKQEQGGSPQSMLPAFPEPKPIDTDEPF